MNTTEQATTPGRTATRVALWLVAGYVVWLVAFIALAPEGYLEDWGPWLGTALFSVLPLWVGLGFAIKGLRLGDRLAWLPTAIHGLLLVLFFGLPLVQRFFY